MGYSLSTIDTVHSALSKSFNDHGCEGSWRSAGENSSGNPLTSRPYQAWLKGLRKTHRNDLIKSSQPMTYGRMSVIDEKLSTRDTGRSHHLSVMLNTLFSLAWYCMLRMDEAIKMKCRDIKFNMTKSINGQDIRLVDKF